MKTKKFETYCNQNLVNLLIKAGFNWQDYFVAHSINENFHWEIPLHIAQKWLREVKEIFIGIISISIEYNIKWQYVIDDYEGFVCAGEVVDTYEESQESGIKKALEIILSKN